MNTGVTAFPQFRRIQNRAYVEMFAVYRLAGTPFLRCEQKWRARAPDRFGACFEHRGQLQKCLACLLEGLSSGRQTRDYNGTRLLRPS